jgi:hypothetical protein
MELFTTVVDFRGGTYVFQAVAENVAKLVPTLAGAIDWKGLGFEVSESEKRMFSTDLAEESPALLQGLANAWCVTALIG